jgi:hypothetical protein
VARPSDGKWEAWDHVPGEVISLCTDKEKINAFMLAKHLQAQGFS